MYPNPRDIVMSQELIDEIVDIDISKTYSIMGGSKNVLACSVLRLRIITGVADKMKCRETRR